MPGNSRDAEGYRNSWRRYADRYDALILVPEFAAHRFDASAYNLGNLVDGAGNPTPVSQRTFTVIEHLYDWVAAEVASTGSGYYLYGHSAGAQFVHRMLLYQPDPRIIAAAAANAGWYTVPDSAIGFPYGLASGPGIDLPAGFGAPLTILVGELDNDPNDPNLRTTDEANAQGATRYDRALHMYERSAAISSSLGLSLRWDLGIVAGVGHSNYGMAPAAAEVLFGSSS